MTKDHGASVKDDKQYGGEPSVRGDEVTSEGNARVNLPGVGRLLGRSRGRVTPGARLRLRRAGAGDR